MHLTLRTALPTALRETVTTHQKPIKAENLTKTCQNPSKSGTARNLESGKTYRSLEPLRNPNLSEPMTPWMEPIECHETTGSTPEPPVRLEHTENLYCVGPHCILHKLPGIQSSSNEKAAVRWFKSIPVYSSCILDPVTAYIEQYSNSNHSMNASESSKVLLTVQEHENRMIDL